MSMAGQSLTLTWSFFFDHNKFDAHIFLNILRIFDDFWIDFIDVKIIQKRSITSIDAQSQ